MSIYFIVDEERPVKVVHNFINLLRPQIHIATGREEIDTLVNYCIYKKPRPYLAAKRYINFDCDLGDRYSVVNVCNQTLVEYPTFPGDYMVRLREGHGNQAKSHRIRSQEEYDTWLHLNPSDHIVQRFIETRHNSRDAYYYSGRIGRAGSSYFPLHACMSMDWNTNIYTRTLKYFDDSSDCLYMIPGYNYRQHQFWKQVYDKFNELKLDLGFIDFSLDRGELVVWEATTAVVFEAPREIVIDAYKRNILETVCRYLRGE